MSSSSPSDDVSEVYADQAPPSMDDLSLLEGIDRNGDPAPALVPRPFNPNESHTTTQHPSFAALPPSEYSELAPFNQPNLPYNTSADLMNFNSPGTSNNNQQPSATITPRGVFSPNLQRDLLSEPQA